MRFKRYKSMLLTLFREQGDGFDRLIDLVGKSGVSFLGEAS